MTTPLSARPNLFLVGAHKAATTSMHGYLSKHPQIHMSEVKEPHFMTPSLRHRLHTGVWDYQQYLGLWQASRARWRGEASVFYLPHAAEFLESIDKIGLEEATVLIILREPVGRAYSAYLDERLKNPAERRDSLAEVIRDLQNDRRARTDSPAMDYLRNGLYADDVTLLMDNLKERVKILLYEDLIEQTESVLSEVQSFLGVERRELHNASQALNTGGKQWRTGIVNAVLKDPRSVRSRRWLRRRAPHVHATARRVASARLTGTAPRLDEQTAALLRAYYANDAAAVRDRLDLPVGTWL